MNKQEVFIGCDLTVEQQRRNKQHHEEVKNKINITGGGVGYGYREYIGKILDETLTVDEIALACDSNLCFGYDGRKLADNTFIIKVYTD